MSGFDLLLVIYGAVLALAALGVVYRMVVGPTILDRALSTDSLVTLVLMGMALYVAESRAAWAGPAMLSLTGMAFIGTIAVARFVAREDPLRTRLAPRAEEPGTNTGPHEAIHLDPIEGDSWEEEPQQGSVGAEDDDLYDDPDPVSDPDRPGEPLEDWDEEGFGAQPGGRGFDDEFERSQEDRRTEGER